MKPAPDSPASAWPVILTLFDPPESVVDFGCGSGHWLFGLRRFLPDIEVFGLNEASRSDAGESLSDDQFRAADLTKPIDLGRQFALAISLEVAEHLPPSAAETLISSISRHSDMVLFSAGIPGQGGKDHLNEQWPEYWIRRFAVHEFQCFDRIRPLIWQNDRISTWYRQNMMLFLRSPRMPKFDGDDWRGMPLVHPNYFGWHSGAIRHRRSLSNLVRFIRGMPMD
jgi:SAM-dependent methyltransferase